jgi:hypothetical protein
MVQGAYTLTYSAHSIHVAQAIVIVQPFFLLKTIVILPFFFVFAMKCKMCQQVANFRARNEGEPFEWWCKWCYDVHEHQQIPDDIEHQTLCIHCKDQPASCRIKSPLKACWEYWCYTCFERFDHKEDFDDFAIVDLDAPSDEYSDESEDPHDHEGEVDTQSCGSFNSWCMPSAGNLKALDIMETQSNAYDAVSVASGSSWALTYQVVDNDDTASVSSFQMLPSVQAVDNDDTASVSSFQMVSACNEQQQEQEHGNGKKMPSFGAWQEDEQLMIALQMSLRDIDEQAEPIADSSSIISSSSSSSSSSNSTAAAAATANVDHPYGQFIPEDGSAASSSPAASAPQTLMLPRIVQQELTKFKACQRIGPKQASKVPGRYVAMEKIDEIVGSPVQIHASEYIDLSGCTDTIFTDKPTTTSIDISMCPIHQLEHNIYCQACTNYQFMKEKQFLSMAMQHSIEDSYDTSSIIFIDQLPYCSSHAQDMKEWCGTCNKAVALTDQMAQMA